MGWRPATSRVACEARSGRTPPPTTLDVARGGHAPPPWPRAATTSLWGGHTWVAATVLPYKFVFFFLNNNNNNN